MKDLYQATVDVIYNYFYKFGNYFMKKDLQKNENIPKIDIVINNIKYLRGIKQHLVFYQKFLVQFFENVKKCLEDKIEVAFDAEYYRIYAVLCGFHCMLNVYDESIFESFDIAKFEHVSYVMGQLNDIKALSNNYLNNYKAFNTEMTKKNVKNKYQKWFSFVFEGNLVKTTKKKKRKGKEKKNIANGENSVISNNNSNSGEINEKENNNGNGYSNSNELETNEASNEQNNINNNLSNEEGKENNNSSDENNISSASIGQNEQINIDKINEVMNKLEDNKSQFTQTEEQLYNFTKLLKDIFFQYKKDNEEKFSNYKKESENKINELSQRILALEEYQVIVYHQLALYQNSRGSEKSIFSYLYKYFDLKGIVGDDDVFKKTQKVFEYLEEKEDSKFIKKEQKPAVRKFLRILFFINSYHNRILHNLLTTKTKKLLESIQRNNKNIAVFPDFNYSQFITSIKYFIENLVDNDEIQAILCESYKFYELDLKLKSIFDKEKEAIILENNRIMFKLEKEELDIAIDFLKDIKINDDNLEKLCDLTSWGKNYGP